MKDFDIKSFLRRYKMIFIFIFIIAVLCFALFYYFKNNKSMELDNNSDVISEVLVSELSDVKRNKNLNDMIGENYQSNTNTEKENLPVESPQPDKINENKSEFENSIYDNISSNGIIYATSPNSQNKTFEQYLLTNFQINTYDFKDYFIAVGKDYPIYIFVEFKNFDTVKDTENFQRYFASFISVHNPKELAICFHKDNSTKTFGYINTGFPDKDTKNINDIMTFKKVNFQ